MLIFIIGFIILIFIYTRSIPKGVRVLMFHKIHPTHSDILTITTEQLTQILLFLRHHDFHIVRINDWQTGKKMPRKPVILTFDDAYTNQLTFAYPILKKFEAYTTIFVPTAFVGKKNTWDEGKEEIMAWDVLKNLDSTIFSLAYHSHQHLNYKKMDVRSIEVDLSDMITSAQQQQLVVEPYFSYPYGARPKDRATYQSMVTAFQKLGIKAAFRIGNRINTFTNNDVYELQRIDIKGNESLKQIYNKIIFCRRW